MIAERKGPNAELKYQIVCPWISEHTVTPETGTYVGQYESGRSSSSVITPIAPREHGSRSGMKCHRQSSRETERDDRSKSTPPREADRLR